MPFTIGRAKTGGRKKGTRNKGTIELAALQDFPTEGERSRVLDSAIRQQNMAPRYEYNGEHGQYVPKVENPEEHFIVLFESLGTANAELSVMHVNQLADVLHFDKNNLLNAALAFLYEQKPRDGIEASILIQAFCAHVLAMSFAVKAASPTQFDLTERVTNLMSKTMRTYTSHIEALNKYRGRGGQKIVVEHVTVNQGGQNVVAIDQRGLDDSNRLGHR